jgi:hypothetical protein
VMAFEDPRALLTPLDVRESLIQQAMQRLAGRAG